MIVMPGLCLVLGIIRFNVIARRVKLVRLRLGIGSALRLFDRLAQLDGNGLGIGLPCALGNAVRPLLARDLVRDIGEVVAAALAHRLARAGDYIEQVVRGVDVRRAGVVRAQIYAVELVRLLLLLRAVKRDVDVAAALPVRSVYIYGNIYIGTPAAAFGAGLFVSLVRKLLFIAAVGLILFVRGEPPAVFVVAVVVAAKLLALAATLLGALMAASAFFLSGALDAVGGASCRPCYILYR